MNPITIFAGQFCVVLLGVVLTWVIARRVVPTRWSAIGWGALAFPLSQIARFALLIPVSVLANAVFAGGDPRLVSAASAVVLVLTSGLFEESARWIVLRYWAKPLRRWRDGVGFGLGHGGIEAILLMGLASINAIVLLATGDAAVEATRVSAPEQVSTLEAQIDMVRSATIGLASLGVYERVVAIVLHVALTLLVLRAVRARRWVWWALAVAIHCGVNAIAVLATTMGNPLLTEAAITVPVLVLLWAIIAGPLSRRRFETHLDVTA